MELVILVAIGAVVYWKWDVIKPKLQKLWDKI